ncbi:hypothetical protein DEJ50_01195 [Streptomyces venezuelae]|uniref:Uncharacterized protein n=1 Tax=Streptomyces venezuelae TaxID=54571 RepID=A0A5P2DCX7_STRVZ|nr:hypothetical protein DEJ50_01195 [Streptomyces venezuelae]
MKPRAGTAEIRHTPRLPYRTVALPPCEGMVYRPGPPSRQSTAGFGAVVRGAPDGVFDGAAAEGEGDGRCPAVGEPITDADAGTGAVGELGPGDGVCSACQAGGESRTVGADRATGGVGLVEPTTNCTVASTAVTLVAVHDSHMSR